ncbi:MAG: ATPase, partial [Acidobacteria bacterium]|nr:ATPase [Acidobacteriota bacterium]
MSYFLGLDGGGSHTRAILVDEQLHRLGRSEAGPSNYLRVGIAAATRALTDAVLKALEESKREVENVEWAYCGIAGSDHPVSRDMLIKAMAGIFPKGNFTVDTDARIALEGAVGPGQGIVVISGTGSVAFGKNLAGEEARAGGWGPTLGDEGSGYAIARAGMTAIVRASDGRGPDTTMTDVLCRLYKICSPADLRYVIYSEESDASRIAKLNRVVVEAAREG